MEVVNKIVKNTEIITIEDVKSLAKHVFNDIKSIIDINNEIMKQIGGDPDNYIVSTGMDEIFSKEYSENSLSNEAFHFAVLRYIYAIKIIGRYPTSAYEAFDISKSMRNAVEDKVNSNIEYSADVYLVKKYSIALNAMPVKYAISVDNAILIDKAVNIAKLIVSEYEYIDLTMFDDYSEFYSKCEDIASEISNKVFMELTLPVVEEEALVQNVISIILKIAEPFGFEGVFDNSKENKLDKTILKVMSSLHEVGFLTKKGNDVNFDDMLDKFKKDLEGDEDGEE